MRLLVLIEIQVGGLNIGDFSDFALGCMVRAYGDVEKAINHTLMAEKSGFDSVALPDHLFHPITEEKFHSEPPWETLTLLGAISSKTDAVKLLTGVTDSVRRHPVVLAHSFSTLDHLSNGRTVLGIGAGEAYNIAFVKDFKFDKPYTRFRECIEIIKDLWKSTEEEPSDYTGEYFRIEDAHMRFKPVQKPYPPIYVGGYGPKMRKLTGKEADGWIPWIHSPEMYGKDLELIIKSAKDSERDPNEIDRGLFIPTLVLSDGDKAKEKALKEGRVFLAHRIKLLRDLGYPDLAEEAPVNWKLTYSREQVERQRKVIEKIPDEAVEKIVVAGTPESTIEQIEQFREGGVNHPMIFPLTNFEETLKNYKEKIIPYFKE